MEKKEKIIHYFEKKFKKKYKLDSRLFLDLEIDSLEFAKIVTELEKILKKKYRPSLIDDFSDLTIKKFLNFFK